MVRFQDADSGDRFKKDYRPQMKTLGRSLVNKNEHTKI